MNVEHRSLRSTHARRREHWAAVSCNCVIFVRHLRSARTDRRAYTALPTTQHTWVPAHRVHQKNVGFTQKKIIKKKIHEFIYLHVYFFFVSAIFFLTDWTLHMWSYVLTRILGLIDIFGHPTSSRVNKKDGNRATALSRKVYRNRVKQLISALLALAAERSNVSVLFSK